MSVTLMPFLPKKYFIVNEKKRIERHDTIKRIASSLPVSYDRAQQEFDRLQQMFPYSPFSDIEKLTVLTIECAIIKGCL